jgi:hypothetical protein
MNAYAYELSAVIDPVRRLLYASLTENNYQLAELLIQVLSTVEDARRKAEAVVSK